MYLTSRFPSAGKFNRERMVQGKGGSSLFQSYNRKRMEATEQKAIAALSSATRACRDHECWSAAASPVTVMLAGVVPSAMLETVLAKQMLSAPVDGRAAPPYPRMPRSPREGHRQDDAYFRHLPIILAIRDLWTKLQFEVLKELTAVRGAAEAAVRERIRNLANAFWTDLNKASTRELCEWRTEFLASLSELEAAAKKGSEHVTKQVKKLKGRRESCRRGSRRRGPPWVNQHRHIR